jgi:hypothetical protein
MKEYICEFCGKDTSDVDYDYLIGWNHLACALSDVITVESKVNKKKKPMEIKNWTKLNGQKFDVMGVSFVIHDTSYVSNVYTTWVYPYNDNEALVRVLLFTDDMHLQIKVLPPTDYDSTMIPIELTTTMTKVHLSNPSIFVQTIAEGLTDDPTVRDIIQFVGRKQDLNRRKKGTGYSPGAGISGSNGFAGRGIVNLTGKNTNNLW